jgi:sulfatase modifying factor 1
MLVKALIAIAALLMVGCGENAENVELPDIITCICGKGISSKSEACPSCGHPTEDLIESLADALAKDPEEVDMNDEQVMKALLANAVSPNRLTKTSDGKFSLDGSLYTGWYGTFDLGFGYLKNGKGILYTKKTDGRVLQQKKKVGDEFCWTCYKSDTGRKSNEHFYDEDDKMLRGKSWSPDGALVSEIKYGYGTRTLFLYGDVAAEQKFVNGEAVSDNLMEAAGTAGGRMANKIADSILGESPPKKKRFGEDDVEGVRKSEELTGGQIFIVTQSRENVRLGLVVVKVFDEDGIEKIRTEAKSFLERLLTTVDANSRWDDFKEDLIDFAIARVTPSAGAKTDADGRFFFKAPSDKFMLAATSSRLTGDEQEKYRWLEVFHRDSIIPSGLFLSNDNLLGDLTGSPAFPSDARDRFDAAVAEEERKRTEKERRKRVEEERKRVEEEQKRVEEELRLARVRAEEKRKRQESITKRVVSLIKKRESFTTDNNLAMIWVKPGTFEMGSPGGFLGGEKGRDDDEALHSVTLTEGYWLAKYEVTQAQWQKVIGSNPSEFKGGGRPVENVSWTDVTSFCKKLTASERAAGRLLAGMTYQLPTEAQWEYACRAGTKTAFSFGDGLSSDQANIYGGPGATTDVGKYPANGWGFYDMHGNVFEWCADWYGDYPRSAARDPVGPAVGSLRVTRGGSWNNSANNARSADRLRDVPAGCYIFLGFRLSLRPASQ